MSSPLNCCSSCATVETVNTPGTEGEAGLNGTDGVNAFTITTEDITFVDGGGEADVGVISVESSIWMVVGQVLIIGAGVNGPAAETEWGHFRVTAIPNATSVQLSYLDYTGDGGGDGVLLTGCTVSPAGIVGPAGP